MARIFVVDDDSSMRELLEARLSSRGYEVASFSSADEALNRLEQEDADVMLVDFRMEGLDGLALCERVVANRPDIPVVVITAYGNMDTAVGAMRVGAFDFLTKPFETDTLLTVVARAVRHRELAPEVRRLREESATAESFGALRGESLAMKRLFRLLAQIASLESSVLITGESGTGKELVARALHENSGRREGPFVGVNCAAVPENLLEAELFGHVKGAFTDARSGRAGLITSAKGGTLFLDEIGEIPVHMQPKLLRVLQERTLRPVGGDTEVTCDVRVIAATNRELDREIEAGRFRADLFYRINVLHVEVPPLRARGEDILLYAQEFIEDVAKRSGKHVLGLSLQAAEKLVDYSWPGNVRELQNCMERAVALTNFEYLTVEDLPERLRSYKRVPSLADGKDGAELVSLEEVERRYIRRVLEATGGNKTMAARILGVDRRTLHRKFDRYRDSDDGRRA
jgi:DNA-binding NtrC family response regulator